MGKRTRKEAEASEKKSNGAAQANKSALWDEKAVDPTLALLFSSSVSYTLRLAFICALLRYTSGWPSPSTSKISLRAIATVEEAEC